jgi:hypothetical protein
MKKRQEVIRQDRQKLSSSPEGFWEPMLYSIQAFDVHGVEIQNTQVPKVYKGSVAFCLIFTDKE